MMTSPSESPQSPPPVPPGTDPAGTSQRPLRGSPGARSPVDAGDAGEGQEPHRASGPDAHEEPSPPEEEPRAPLLSRLLLAATPFILLGLLLGLDRCSG